MSRLGFDVDGVLADFNTSFILRVIDVTGRDLFPPRPFDIPTWDYPQFYGYTEQEMDTVWKSITADIYFWENLTEYPDTSQALQAISRQSHSGDDIYFITSRPGLRAKRQTEKWLRGHGLSDRPTVLISSHKGLCAAALKLDAYIDDRWENTLDVAQTHTQTYLLTRPWNQGNKPDDHSIIEVPSVTQFIERLQSCLIS